MPCLPYANAEQLLLAFHVAPGTLSPERAQTQLGCGLTWNTTGAPGPADPTNGVRILKARVGQPLEEHACLFELLVLAGGPLLQVASPHPCLLHHVAVPHPDSHMQRAAHPSMTRSLRITRKATPEVLGRQGAKEETLFTPKCIDYSHFPPDGKGVRGCLQHSNEPR